MKGTLIIALNTFNTNSTSQWWLFSTFKKKAAACELLNRKLNLSPMGRLRTIN